MTAELEHIKIDTDSFDGTIIKVECKPCEWVADKFFLQVPEGISLANAAQSDHNNANHHGTSTTTAPCHDCSCHRNPPCSNCENCLHMNGEIECPNDCRTCEEPHEYEPA